MLLEERVSRPDCGQPRWRWITQNINQSRPIGENMTTARVQKLHWDLNRLTIMHFFNILLINPTTGKFILSPPEKRQGVLTFDSNLLSDLSMQMPTLYQLRQENLFYSVMQTTGARVLRPLLARTYIIYSILTLHDSSTWKSYETLLFFFLAQ
jgi:hypothetical protein